MSSGIDSRAADTQYATPQLLEDQAAQAESDAHRLSAISGEPVQEKSTTGSVGSEVVASKQRMEDAIEESKNRFRGHN
jgi:hypothetical protein